MPEVTTHTHTAKGQEVKDAPSKWITTDDLANIICEAFRDGEQKGKKKAIEEFMVQFKKQYDAALEIYKALFDRLQAEKIKCRSIHVRLGGVNAFEAIFVIPTKDYYNDNFAKVVNLSRGYKHPNPAITLNYRFMPFSKRINYSVLSSDGFSTTYHGNNGPKA